MPCSFRTSAGWIEVNSVEVSGTRIRHTAGDATAQINPWYGSVTWNRVILDVGSSDIIRIVVDIVDHGAIETAIETVSVTITNLETTNTTP